MKALSFLAAVAVFVLVGGAGPKKTFECGSGDLYEQHSCLLAVAIRIQDHSRVAQLLEDSTTSAYIDIDRSIPECENSPVLNCSIITPPGGRKPTFVDVRSLELLLDHGADLNAKHSSGTHMFSHLVMREEISRARLITFIYNRDHGYINYWSSGKPIIFYLTCDTPALQALHREGWDFSVEVRGVNILHQIAWQGTDSAGCYLQSFRAIMRTNPSLISKKDDSGLLPVQYFGLSVGYFAEERCRWFKDEALQARRLRSHYYQKGSPRVRKFAENVYLDCAIRWD